MGCKEAIIEIMIDEEVLKLLGFKNDILTERILSNLSTNNPYPHTSKDVVDLITKHLKKDSICFEWGSGFSTLYYSKLVERYISIDNQNRWILLLSRFIRENPEYKNIELYYCPLVTVQNDESKYTATRYHKVIHAMGYKRYDFIYIDGMIRDDCAKEALDYIDENTLVVFDDYYKNEYQVCHEMIEKYYDVERISSDSNAVKLRKKHG